MSDRDQRYQQDQVKETKTRNNSSKNNHSIQHQVKKDIQNVESKDRLKDLNYSLQGKDFLCLSRNKSQLNQEVQEISQIEQSQKKLAVSQSQKQNIMNSKITNPNRSSSTKINQNLKTLQQIEEFALQGKKINDCNDKNQLFITPKNQKNVTFEPQNQTCKAQKFLNQSFDFQIRQNEKKHHTAFPNITKQQQKKFWQQSQFTQNQNFELIAKSHSQLCVPNEKLAKSKPGRVQYGQEKLQYIAEKNSCYGTNISLQTIIETQEKQDLEENYSHQDLTRIQDNKKKRDISQTQLRGSSLENQDKQAQKHLLPNITVNSLSDLNIKTQFQPQKDQLDLLVQSVKLSGIKKYKQPNSNHQTPKRNQYKLQISGTFDFVIKGQEGQRENLNSQSFYQNQALNDSLDKTQREKSAQQNLSNSILQSKIKRKGNQSNQQSQKKLQNIQQNEGQQQKETFSTSTRKIVIDGSNSCKNSEEINNLQVVINYKERDQSQKTMAQPESKSFQTLKDRYIQNSRNKFPLKIVTKGLEDKTKSILESKIKEVKSAEIYSKAFKNKS